MEQAEITQALERCENQSLPATIEDARALAMYTDQVAGKVAHTIDTVAATAIEIKKLSAEVEKEYARLENALDCLMVKARRDMRIYEMSLPVLDKQFSTCQNRMDRLMDKAMDMICGDISADSLARQEAMMNLIEITNNSLNSLISKLIPQY